MRSFLSKLTPRSLTAKLTLAFLFIGLAGALLVSVLLSLQTRSAFDQFIQNNDQQTLANSLVQYYQDHGSWAGVANNLQSFPGNQPPQGGPNGPHELNRFTLVDANRNIIVGGVRSSAGNQVSSRDLAGAVPLTVSGQTVGWLIQPGGLRSLTPNSPEANFLTEINQATLLSALIAALLALLLGGLLAFTLTRSLRELTEATVDLAAGKLGRQVKIRSKDELGELATSFNKMSQDLERSNQARRQMTADIAHDLRSPLSVISGYAEALSEGKLPGTPETYTILYQEAQQLSRQVDDLRTLSLADAGELHLNQQPVEPKTLLEHIAIRQSIAAQQKGISIRVAAAPDLPPVKVDPERMAQVLDNLVSNALRYTPQGGEILLSAKMMAGRAGDGKLRLEVRDTGSGIATEDLPHIFDRYYRGDKSRHQGSESGLGLAIAKSIVEAHGGEMTVESSPGEGAVFFMTLLV